MWRRVVSATRTLLGSSPAPASRVVRRPAAPVSLDEYADAKTAAYYQLKNSVSELSSGTSKPIFPLGPKLMSLWMDQTPIELSIAQLEELAGVHLDGKGVAKDELKAVEYLNAAAARGSINARYSLAVCKKDGKGMAMDKEAAFRELKDLADTHNLNHAHYAVGLLYDKGEGCQESAPRAAQYFMNAAAGGIIPAGHNLANMLAIGRGVEQDIPHAIEWYQNTADAGDPAACFTLGSWYHSGKGGLKPDKRKSFDLQLFAANAQHAGAMYNVGVALLQGDGVLEDAPKAAEWFEKAAALGFHQALFNLAKMHIVGKGVPKDLHKARKIILPMADRDKIAKEMVEAIDQMIVANKL